MATRRERVVMDLESNLPQGMLESAAAVAVLRQELKRLDGDYSRLSTTSVQSTKVTQAATKQLDQTATSAAKADRGINQLTGRLRVLGEVAAILGPTLTPLGGVAIAGIGGLANQLGLAAVAGGVLIGSLQGVGDALGAMNKAQLEPTEANLEAAHKALKALSPAAREFAREAFALKPALKALRDLGAEELMPGLTESLENLERLGPEVAGIMESVAGALGEIASDSSASLASDRWEGFFEFLRTETPRVMGELATTVGDLTHGLSELWMAFEPLNSDFSSWLMNVADSFDGWASGLSATDGFAEFIDYIRTTGPQVGETLGAIASAAIQIVQATAPLGGPVLAGVEAFANVVSSLADSDLGTPILAGVAALALLNRSLAVTASLSKVSLSSGLFSGLGTASKGIKGQAGSIKSDIAAMSDRLVVFGSNADAAGKAAERMKGRLAAGAGLAGLAVAASGAADGLGLTNTMSLALMGSLGGPPGIAIGAAAGALLDVKAAGEGATAAIQGLDAAVQSGDMGVLKDQIAAAKAELADITDLDFGGDIFDRIGFQVADTFGGPSMDEAKAKIEDSERALKDLEQQEKLSGIAAKGAALDLLIATDANVDLGKWSGKSTEQIKAQADALTKAQESASETAASFVTLGDSLDDGKVSLSDWIKEMADSADALRNFTNNSRTAAKRGLDDGLIESLQQAGEQGARRMRQLANASDEEIGRANAAWRKGQKAMQEYNDYKVPPKKVTADTSRAMQSFREVDQYLSSLNGKTATTYVNTVRTVTGPKGAAVFGQKAGGGSVPKDGGPYSDRFLFMLAPGEEIITNRNGEADKFRADRAAGRIPGYADGGTTGKKPKRGSKAVFEESITQTFGPDAIRDMLQAAEMQAQAARDQEEAARIGALAAQDQLDAAQATADAAKQSLDAAEAMQKSFRDSVSGQFSSSLTGGGLAGLVQNVSRDTNAGASMDATLQALVAAGLDPTSALYRELAQSEDLQTANELLASGSSYIASVQQQVSDRNQVNLSRGTTSADQSFGQMVSEQQAAYSLAQAQLAQQQAQYSAQESYHAQATAQRGSLEDAVRSLAGQLADAINSTVRGGRR